MRNIELDGLDSTIHKTHQWLNDIMAALGVHDAHLAYGGLRAVLHALRDRLTLEETVQLGAQLPMLIRGLYYEGWSPRREPRKTHKAEFLEVIRKQFPACTDRMHPEVLARAVLTVLARHISAGEVDDVKAILPSDLKDLWPGGDTPAVR